MGLVVNSRVEIQAQHLLEQADLDLKRMAACLAQHKQAVTECMLLVACQPEELVETALKALADMQLAQELAELERALQAEARYQHLEPLEQELALSVGRGM